MMQLDWDDQNCPGWAWILSLSLLLTQKKLHQFPPPVSEATLIRATTTIDCSSIPDTTKDDNRAGKGGRITTAVEEGKPKKQSKYFSWQAGMLLVQLMSTCLVRLGAFWKWKKIYRLFSTSIATINTLPLPTSQWYKSHSVTVRNHLLFNTSLKNKQILQYKKRLNFNVKNRFVFYWR